MSLQTFTVKLIASTNLPVAKYILLRMTYVLNDHLYIYIFFYYIYIYISLLASLLDSSMTSCSVNNFSTDYTRALLEYKQIIKLCKCNTLVGLCCGDNNQVDPLASCGYLITEHLNSYKLVTSYI